SERGSIVESAHLREAALRSRPNLITIFLKMIGGRREIFSPTVKKQRSGAGPRRIRRRRFRPLRRSRSGGQFAASLKSCYAYFLLTEFHQGCGEPMSGLGRFAHNPRRVSGFL